MSDLITSMDFDCPYCHKEFELKISSIGKSVKCPYCHKDIETEDAGIVEGIDRVNDSIDDFLNSL